jgi:hypothetical protein
MKMRATVTTICFVSLLLISIIDSAMGADELFARAEEAYQRSGPLAGVRVCLPDAKKGDPRAAFYVGTFYVAGAALQRRRQSSPAAITKLENAALHWYSVAQKGGNEEARIILTAVRKQGRGALYIGTEHILGSRPSPERDFSRYHWPEQGPRQ